MNKIRCLDLSLNGRRWMDCDAMPPLDPNKLRARGRWVVMAGDSCLRCAPAESVHRAPAEPGGSIRRVLVTGGAGYIGSTLVRGLLADGLRVRVLDSLLKGDAGIRALYTNPDFELIRGDVRQAEPLVRAARGVDAVIHLAGVTGAAECRREKAAAVEINVAATSLLTEICRGMGVSRLVLASTLDVYGWKRRVADELSEPDPQTLFAATKLDAERLMLASGDGRLHPVVFRLGDVFGAGLHPDFSRGLNRLAFASWRRGRLPVRLAARPIHRTHLADVCAVLRQSMVARAEVIGGEVFDVGCETMLFSDKQAATVLAEAAAELESSWPAEAKTKPPMAPALSFEKLRERLGVACRGALREGLAELVAHLRRGVGPLAYSGVPSWPRLPPADLAATRFVGRSR